MFLTQCGVCWIISILVFGLLASYKADEILYMRTEHPKVTFTDPVYIPYANLTSWRFGRKNPVYYVGLNFETRVHIDNNVRVDFYIYEFLTNVYKPSFVELHYGFCNLLKKDMLFGAAMGAQPDLSGPCPYPPGVYRLANMTVLPDAIPKGFPFTKGRIYANFTYVPKKALLASGYVDMELRTLKVKSRKKLEKL